MVEKISVTLGLSKEEYIIACQIEALSLGNLLVCTGTKTAWSEEFKNWYEDGRDKRIKGVLLFEIITRLMKESVDLQR